MAPRRVFGTTWWGEAWIDSLEHRARLDANRLPRGRTYARQARVGTLHLETGVVRALVQGNRPSPYTTQVEVRPYSDDEWHRLFDVIAARASHAAALLDGELPPQLLDDTRLASLNLLPGAGDVTTSCTCPDWANPCKHAAAVCYLIADLMDDDPFTIFALRGRDREQVMADVRSRRSSAASARKVDAPTTAEPRSIRRLAPIVARAAVRDTTVAIKARDAWRAAGDVAAQRARLDSVPRVATPLEAASPAALGLDPPAASGISASDLHHLAADAARRAWAMLAMGEPSQLALSRNHDVARRADAATDEEAFDDIARTAAMPLRRLTAHALAWQYGGAEGVDITDTTWAPRAEQLTQAKQAITEFGIVPRVRDNRVSAGDFQLRLGRSGLWYRFERRHGAWELTGPPDPDPGELLLLD